MLNNYTRWITHHPLWMMLFSLILLTGAGIGIGQLSFKSDLRIYFDKNNPQIAALDHMEKTYTKPDNVLFVLAPRNGVFNTESLAVVEELTANSWKIPYSSRVDSISNFKHSSANGDDVLVEDFVTDAKHLTASEIEKIRNVALNEPLLADRIISPNGKVTGVNVTINIPKGLELSSNPVVVKYARKLADDIKQKHPDIDIYLSGGVMMDNAFAESSEKDMKTLVPAMLIISLVIMGMIMRSWLASVAALLVLTFSIVGAMGFAGWLGILLNPVSINAPNIIITVAICDCVHVLMAYLLGLNKGLTKQEAMQHCLSENFSTLLFTNLTTIVGFLTMNYCDAPPFRDLGNMTALGVVFAFIFTMTFLPAFMMLFKANARIDDKPGKLQTIINILAEKIIAQPKKYFFASLLFVVVACAGIFNNVLNDEFIKYFDKNVTFRQDTDFTAEHLTGIYFIDYEIGGKTESGINDPAYLQSLDQFVNWLREQPEVVHVNSITDIYKKLNMNMHGDSTSQYGLPTSNELAAQYLLLYEMSLPYGLDLRDRINAEKTATRVTATLKNLSSAEVLAIESRTQDWLKAHQQHITYSDGTGLTLMFANIGLRNIKSMLVGNIISAIFISLTLILIFRSFKYGVISLIPNLLPAAMAFGIWGVLVGQIGLALSVMSSMTLGVVVDDTVHFLTKYLKARREKNLTTEDALRYAFNHGGTALITTSVALAAGFGVLGFSSFEINSSMGILTAVAIMLAMLLDLFLMPSLLLVIDSVRQKKTAHKSKPIDQESHLTIPNNVEISTN